MKESLQEFWYLYVLLAVLAVVAVIAFKKAMSLSKSRHGEFNAVIKKLEREKELRDTYKNLTNEIISNAPEAALFQGVALNLEAQCQRCESTDAFYSALTQPQKNVYALYYLFTDAKSDGLSAFFKGSTRPLTSDAAQGIKTVLPGQLADTVNAMFDCYDEENESASVVAETVDRLNAEYENLAEGIDTFAAVGAYIKDNSAFFIEM